MKKPAWLPTGMTFLVFVLFMVFVLPGEAAKSAELGLTVSPDTSFFYTAHRLYDIAGQYGETGRAFYIEQRFTFDLVWPLVYGAFLTTSLLYFGPAFSAKRRIRWIILPIVAVVFDYLENIMTATVMHRYPLETIILDDLAGLFTAMKWITLSLSFVVLVVSFGMTLIHRTKKEEAR